MRWMLAIDLHARPDAVINEAVAWAHRHAVTLDLLYVDDVPASFDFIHDPMIRQSVIAEHDRLVGLHRQRLDGLLAKVPEAIRGKAIHGVGGAASFICEHTEGYDAILVATHGRRGFERFWMGSVAERVVRLADVPVIVLRVSDQEEP